MRASGFVLVLAALAGLFGIAPALAADRDVLRQFGMLGRLALDCSLPTVRAIPT
jgi:hypothetical protein